MILFFFFKFSVPNGISDSNYVLLTKIIKQYIAINFENKLKIKNCEIVPVDKSNELIITNTNDIHKKSIDFIDNNSIQTLVSDFTLNYTKEIKR